MLRFAFKIDSEFRHFHEPLLNLWVNDSYQNPGTRIQIKRARDDTALSHWISLVSKTLDRMKLSLLFFSLFFSLSYVLFGTPSRLELNYLVGVSLSFIKLGPAHKRASLVTTSTIPLPACVGASNQHAFPSHAHHAHGVSPFWRTFCKIGNFVPAD